MAGHLPVVRAWHGLVLAALGVAVVLSLWLVAFRVPLLQTVLPGLPAFRGGLLLHAVFAAVLWPLLVLGYIGARGVAGRGTPRGVLWSWGTWGTAVLGLVLLLGVVLFGGERPVLLSYLPGVLHPAFLVALALVAAGAVLSLLGSGFRATDDLPVAPGWLSPPLILALLTVAAAWGGSASLAGHVRFEVIAWASGHTLQFAWGALLSWSWLYQARRLWPERGIPRPGLWVVMAGAGALVGPVAALLAPADSEAFLRLFAMSMRWAVWLAPALLAALLLVRLISSGRPERVGAWPLGASLAIFFLGLVLGAAIDDQTMMLTAHLHAALGALVVSLLGGVLRGASGASAGGRKSALLVFVGGFLLAVAGLVAGDVAGWPRKLPVPVTGGGRVAAAMLLFGALLAAVGYALWAVRSWRDGVVTGSLSAVPGARRLDVRWRALAVTVGGIVLIGVLVSGLPRVDLSVLTPPPTGPAARLHHADQAITQEIDQRFRQGVAMLHARQYEFAVKAFHRVLELDPMIPEAHVNMGFALLGQKDYVGAQRFFEGATALNKDQVNAYYGMGLALEGLGNPGAASGALRTYLHLAPPDDPFREAARAKLQVLDRAFREERRQRGETIPEEREP